MNTFPTVSATFDHSNQRQLTGSGLLLMCITLTVLIASLTGCTTTPFDGNQGPEPSTSTSNAPIRSNASLKRSALISNPVTAPRPLPEIPSRPNIILIVADDLGYGDLGSYGQDVIKTPRLDALASEGLRFKRFYAGSTVCAPSRCVLMTGLHTGHCHIRGNGPHPLLPGTETIASILKKEGYKTAGIGKWGLGLEDTTGNPLDQGFDDFFGYLHQGHAHNYYPAFLVLNNQRIPLANIVPDAKPSGAGVASEKIQYSHDLFIESALSYIKLNKDNPFFLYLPLTIPHANNEAGKEGMEVPDFGIYSYEDWPDPQKGLAAMITRLDTDIGRILDQLDSLGLNENTIVLFTSDNGPHREGGNDPDFFDSNGPLRGIKRDLYEGGIRVPLIARWPGVIPPGMVTEHISGFQDILPTLTEITGSQDITPNFIDGISFLPTLLNRTDLQKKHSHLYWEFHEQGGKSAVLQDNWKAIYLAGKNRLELYNLKSDPSESKDVSGGNLSKTIELRALMESSRSPSEIWDPKKDVEKIAPPTNLSHDIVTLRDDLPVRSFKLIEW